MPRRKKPQKRFDHTEFVKTLEDLGFSRGFFSCLGIVQAAQDGGVHFDLDTEDMTVEVQLMPSEVILTARVGTVAGGFGAGIWLPPPVGAEVLVAIPDGDLEFQPTIASWYSSGKLPEDIGATTLVIACPPGGKIFVHDGTGSVDQVVLKSAYEAHVHPTGVGPSGVADNALASTSYSQVLFIK